MRAGDLKHRITIERATESVSPGGAVTKTWSTFAQLWAEIIPRGTSRQYTALYQEFSESTLMFRVRGRVAVTEKMRISHQGRYFDIMYPPIGADGRAPLYASELLIFCREAQEQVA